MFFQNTLIFPIIYIRNRLIRRKLHFFWKTMFHFTRSLHLFSFVIWLEVSIHCFPFFTYDDVNFMTVFFLNFKRYASCLTTCIITSTKTMPWHNTAILFNKPLSNAMPWHTYSFRNIRCLFCISVATCNRSHLHGFFALWGSSVMMI